MTLKADPLALTQGGTVVEAAGQQASEAASALRDGCRTASGACGSGRVSAALDRFTAAWGGELLSWGLTVQELSRIAVENGRQVATVNGITSVTDLFPAPASPFPFGPTMPALPTGPTLPTGPALPSDAPSGVTPP